MPTPSPSRMRPRTRPGTRFSEVLDVSLTAQCLTVSADTVYDLFQRGDLPGWKVGRTWLITKAAVLWWLEGVDHAEYGSRAGRRARPRPCRRSAWRAGEKAMGISSP